MAGASPPSLTNLANELLDKIASYLDHDSYPYSRRDLHSFALVCRNTKDSAYDVLYRSYTNLHAGRPFSLFLRTIAHRPDLSQKVKDVCVRGWDAEGCSFQRFFEWIPNLQRKPLEYKLISHEERLRLTKVHYDRRPRDEDLFNLCVDLSLSIGLLTSDLWRSTLSPDWFYQGSTPSWSVWSVAEYQLVRSVWDEAEEGHLLLILSLLPDLKLLDVRGWRIPHTLKLEWTWFFQTCPAFLVQLESFSVEVVGSGHETHPFLRYASNARSLQVLKLSNGIRLSQNPAQSTTPTSVTNLKALSLSKMPMTLDYINSKTFHGGIEHFEYIECLPHSYRVPLNPADVLACLVPSKNVLTHLHLVRPLGGPGYDAHETLSSSSNGYIAQFDHLTSLHIDIWTLLKLSGHPFNIDELRHGNTTLGNIPISQIFHEQLPASLLSLRLLDVTSDFLDMLWALVDFLKEAGSRRLEVLEVEFNRHLEEPYPYNPYQWATIPLTRFSDAEQKLEIAFANVGVRLLTAHAGADHRAWADIYEVAS